MKKAQTDQGMDPAAASAEERTARHLRLLARLAEMGMEVAEATRTEAVEAPQPGVDYCARFATAARAVRLTVLLEERMGDRRREEQREARRRAVGRRMAVVEANRPLRVFLAVAAAIDETIESEEDGARLGYQVREYLERPEVAERVESCPAPAMVAELCEKYGLPPETNWWLAIADAAMEELGFLAPEDDPPAPRRPGRSRSRKPRAPDTG
ncbi:hypothetical protein KXS07_00400 [Inquilinus limosus]|uniref:hypothetical protein n=1 Tax=Inquilinus limosus TaxID=171674 RepID=UPI003F157759